VCKLVGVDLPADYRGDGEDVSDILQGQSRPRQATLFWEWRFRIAGEPHHHSPMLSVRDGQWKLLFNPDRSRIELYDIPNDRMELNNLAGQHPEIANQLAEKALAWQATLPKGPLEPAAGKINYGWPGAVQVNPQKKLNRR
jgi:hypothetical protein